MEGIGRIGKFCLVRGQRGLEPGRKKMHPIAVPGGAVGPKGLLRQLLGEQVFRKRMPRMFRCVQSVDEGLEGLRPWVQRVLGYRVPNVSKRQGSDWSFPLREFQSLHVPTHDHGDSATSRSEPESKSESKSESSSKDEAKQELVPEWWSMGPSYESWIHSSLTAFIAKFTQRRVGVGYVEYWKDEVGCIRSSDTKDRTWKDGRIDLVYVWYDPVIQKRTMVLIEVKHIPFSHLSIHDMIRTLDRVEQRLPIDLSWWCSNTSLFGNPEEASTQTQVLGKGNLSDDGVSVWCDVQSVPSRSTSNVQFPSLLSSKSAMSTADQTLLQEGRSQLDRIVIESVEMKDCWTDAKEETPGSYTWTPKTDDVQRVLVFSVGTFVDFQCLDAK